MATDWKESDEHLIRRGELILELGFVEGYREELEALNRGKVGPEETETVIRCIRHWLRHGMRPGTPEDMLREAVALCWGADDCGLCRRVLEA